MVVIYLILIVSLVLVGVECIRSLPDWIHRIRMQNKEAEQKDLETEILKEKRDNAILNQTGP